MQGELREQEGRSVLRKALDNFSSCEVELINVKKSGEVFNNLLTVSPINSDNHNTYFIGVQHDITYLKLQEEKLRQQAFYIQNILDAQENIVIVTNGSEIIYANEATQKFLGYATLENFVQQYLCICNRFIPDTHYFHLGKVPEGELWMETLLRLPIEERTVIMQSFDSVTHYLNAKVVHFGDHQYIVTFTDVSATLLKEEILTNKAYHDPLTGVFNRQFLHEFVAKWVLKGELASSYAGIILLDIDNFKNVNDTYGHLKGDEVLQILTRTIRQVLRNSDKIFRWGGEEFVVILDIDESNQLLNISEKIRLLIEQTAIKEIGNITCSFGVTIMHQEELLVTVLERADEALYRAKKLGKNRVEFTFTA